jgi:hypothetical protein
MHRDSVSFSTVLLDRTYIVKPGSRVSDPHWLYADPDSKFVTNVDPDDGKCDLSFREHKRNVFFYIIFTTLPVPIYGTTGTYLLE